MDLVHASFSDPESSFHHCAGHVELVHASFSARKYLESSFHHCGSLVKLVHTSFSARKYLESSFHCCGGPVKLVLAFFSTRKDPESSFHHWDVLWRSCKLFWSGQGRFNPVGYLLKLAHATFSARKAIFTTLEAL